jgi:hypothetical protein
MKWLPLCAVALLAACNTPSPEFWGAERFDTSVSGIDFRVFIAGDRVQFIRTSTSFAVSEADMRRLGAEAVEKVSNCEALPHTLVGDAVIVSGFLAC